MTQYLVIAKQSFFDAHNEQYDGKTEIFITTNTRFINELHPDKYYFRYDYEYDADEEIEAVDLDDFIGDEDGYLSTLWQYQVKEITDNEVEIYTKIITDYQNLLNTK